MKTMNRFSEPAQNWDSQVWSSNFSTYIANHPDAQGDAIISDFVELCIRKFSKYGCDKTIEDLKIVKTLLSSEDKLLKEFPLSYLEMCSDFLGLIHVEHCPFGSDVLARINSASNSYNACKSLVAGDTYFKLEIERIAGLPFDYCDCRGIVNFKGTWYTLEKCGVWASEDSRSWIKIDVGQKIWSFERIKLVDGIMVVFGNGPSAVSYSNRKILYTADGDHWSCVNPPKTKGYQYDIDLFYGANEFVAVEYYKGEYAVEESGLFGKSRKLKECYSSTIWTKSSLHAVEDWEEDQNWALERGYYFCDNSFYTDGVYSVGVASLDCDYAKDLKKENERAKFVYSYVKNSWSNASVPTDTFLWKSKAGLTPEKRLVARFYPFAGKLLCYVDNYGLYCSDNNGLEWKSCDTKYDCGHGKLCVGEGCVVVYCEEQNKISISFDGHNFHSMILSQNMDVAYMLNDIILFVDKDSNRGGMFVAKLIGERH